VRRFLARGRLSPGEALEARRVLATITVDSLADNTTVDAFTTLREAITTANASADNDTIVFASSLFTGGPGTITLGSALPSIVTTTTGGSLTITGPGATTLTLTANNGNYNVLTVNSGGNASLSGVTVTGVNTTNYGALRNSGTLALDGVIVSNNYAGLGAAGIYSASGSTLTVANSLISGNTSPMYGGGLRVHGSTTITNTVIAGNAAGSEGGGGLYNSSGTVSISNSTIRGNRTGAGGGNNWGGGIASTGTMTIDACEISDNASVGDGGGVYSNNTLTITNSTISGNRSLGRGGGIINGRTLSVSNSTIAANAAVAGGGIYNNYLSNNVTVISTILGDNLGADYGWWSGGGGTGPGTNGASTNNLVTQGSFTWATTVTSAQLNLGVLQNNGGPTRTQALVTGSAAISSTVLGTPTLDQRGFTRTTADIGAYSYNYTGAGGIVVSQDNEKQVVLTLPATASLSDLQVAYDSTAKTVTITPVASGFSGSTTFVPSGGIAGITAGTSGGNNTVVVDLATQTAFGGIAVVTTSGTGTTTLSGAIDLSLITGGAANQSITVSTLGGAGSTSSLSFSSAIKAKGSGSITLGAGSISGSTTLVASSVSANAASGMTLATQATAFGRIGNLGSGTTTITQTGAALLSSVVIKGDLALTSSGAITQATSGVVSVTGSSVFDSGGAAVTLNSAINDFTGGVTVNSSAASVSLRDANALTITSLSLATNAAVTAIAGTTLAMPAGDLSTGTGNIDLQAYGSVLSPSGTLTTTSGTVSLYGASGLTIANNITSTSGSITLNGSSAGSGIGINAGVTVNAGSGTILLDGNDGSISFAGSLTTTSNANNAVVIQDASTVSLGAITTGVTGTLRLGYGSIYDKTNGDRITGLVTQTGIITAGTLSGCVAAGASLTANNAIATVNDLTSCTDNTGSFTLNDVGGITLTAFTNNKGASSFTTTGLLTLGSYGYLNTDYQAVSLTGVGVTSQISHRIYANSLSVNGGAGAIAMGTGNAIAGTLSLTNTGAFDVSVGVMQEFPNDGWLRLGTSSIGGNLTLSGYGIVQSGVLTVGGNSTFTATASGYDIDLGTYANDLAGTVTVNSAGNIRDFKLRNVNAAAGAITNLTNAAATQLRDLSIVYPNAAYALPSLRQATLRNVVVSAGGAITQASGGITPTGTAGFTTGSFAITLDDAANNFGGAVSLTNTGANDAAVTDATALILGTSSVGRNLAATATAFSQSGVLTVAGTITLTAAAAATDIDLATQANNLAGTVTVNSAANVRDFKLRNVNAAAGAVTNLTNAAATSLRDLSILYSAAGYELPSLRPATLRNVVVSAGGAITQAAGGITPTGTARFTTGSFAITLTDPANDFGGAVSLANTGVNDLDVTAAGGFSLGDAITASGDVTITAAGAISVGNTITAAGRTVTLDSTGGAVNGGGTITAGVVDLGAATGIGTTTALNLAATTIAADSTAGRIDLNNALGAAVTVTSLTTAGTANPGDGVPMIAFDQSGGGTVTFNNVSTASSVAGSGWGVITLTNAGGGITIGGTGVTSAGTSSTISLTTTGSGDIAVNAPIDAQRNDGNVSLVAASRITGAGLITGSGATLIAGTGIAANADMSNGFFTITSAAGDISVANVWSIGVPNAITTTGDVSLTSGQWIVVANPITATGKTVTLTANGGFIEGGSSLVTANIVDLNATVGIGMGFDADPSDPLVSKPLNLAAFFVSAETTSGAIDIDNTSGTAVSVTSLTTTGSGSIRFDQTGAGGIGIDGPVTTGTGTITLTSQQGIIGSGFITTGGTLDATAPTGLSVATAVATLGTISVANGQLAIVDAGTLAVAGPVTVGSHASITATGGLMTITGAISNAGSDLVLSATGIDQTGGAITSRNATISGNGGNVSLTRTGNNFTGPVAITNTGSATTAITDSNAIEFGAVSVGTGTFTVNSTGNITQKVGTGITTGGAVVLNPGTGSISFNQSSNDFGGAVSATTTAPAFIVLRDSNSIRLGAISAGGHVTVTSVGVTQDTSGITVAGNAVFNVGAGGVALTDSDNDFRGLVSVNNSGANNVAITDTNAIQLGILALGSGTLAVTAVGITQADSITQAAGAGTATFNGGAGPISLTNPGNNFRGSVTANTTGAHAIQITDADALSLGGIATADALTIVAGDDVTQAAGSALDVTGATSVTATGFAILLTNTGNDLSGAVSLTGDTVAVTNAGGLLLGPATASGTYAATALSGDIRQQAAPAAGIAASGAATFTANGTDANIILDNPTNAFAGRVNIVAGDANDVTIFDAGPSQLTLAAIAINRNLVVSANGVTQLGTISVAGTTSITSTGGHVDLGSTANDFDTVSVTTTGTAATVDLGDTDGITFLASTLGTGGFIVDAKSIAQTGAITQQASAGPVSLTAREGTLVLDQAGNSFRGTVSASTTQGNALSLTSSTAITLGTVTASAGTAPAGGPITITANGVSAAGGADSITTTGDILLQPLSKTTTIGVATSGTGIDVEFAQSVFATAITSGAARITIGRADQSGTITVGAVTFRDPTVIRAPAGSVAVSGIVTGSDNASIWIQAAPNTVTLAANIVTEGGAITIDDGAGGNTSVVLGASTVLDTTNGGAVITGGAVTIRGTVTSAPLSSVAFQVKAGTDGDVLVTDTIGDVGPGVALASLWITGNDISLASIDGVVGNSSVEATDGTDTGSVTLTGQTYATSGGLNLSAGPRNPSNVVSNPLTLTGGAAGSTTTIATGGNVVELSGAVGLNGRNLTIDTTAGGSVSTGGQVLINDSIDGAGTLAIDAGTAGVVGVNHLSGAVGGMTPLTAVTLTNAHTAEFGRNVWAGTVTITDATNSVRFAGVMTLTTGLVTAAQPYDLTFLGGNGGANSIAGATTFLNTGALQLGDTGSDTFTFAGGVVATAPSGVSLGSTVAATSGVITLGDSNTTVAVSTAAAIGGASTGAISLGPVILANGAAMTVGTGIANAIQLGSISGTAGGAGSDVTVNTTGAVAVTGAVGTDIGGLTITNSGGTTFQSTVDADLVTITDTTGTVTFQNALTAGGLTTATRGYAVALLGDGSAITSVTTFANTGGVTLGDGGDTITFDGGVTSTASTTTINGTVATSGDSAAFGGVTLGGNSIINATGGIETQAIMGGGFDLQLMSGNSDASILGAATSLGAVTLMSNSPATGLVWFRNSLVATEIVTFAQAYRVRLAESGTTTITNATNFLHTGTLQIGNSGTLATFTGGLTTTAGPSGTTLAGTIATANAALGAVTLADDTTLTGATPTFTAAVAGAGHDLALDFSGTTVITGAFTGVRNLSTGNGGGTTLSGAITTSGTQIYGDAVTLADDTTLNGTTPTFANGVTGAGHDLALDFSGTTVITGAFTGIRNLSTGNGGGTTLSGAITTSGTQIYGDAVTLADDTTLAGTTVTTHAAVIGSGKALAITGNASVGNVISGVTTYSVSGTTSLGAGVATTGTQAYTGLVTLTADATLSGTTPTFTNGVAGVGHDLALDFSGTTAITGAFTGIRNLSTGNGGGTTLSGAITTSGTQIYGDAVTLADDTTLNGTTPTFTNGVTGAGHDLALDFSGTTVITGGAFTGVRNLSTANGGGTTLSGAITTSGTQIYGDAVTLADDATLNGTTPTFANGVTGAGHDLALDFSGTTVITGAFTGIRNLSTGNGGGTTLSGAITTSGTQIYGDAVTLADDATLNGTTPTFANGVTGAGHDLAFDFSGTTVITAAFTGIRNLSTGNGGGTTLSGTITTSGTQIYGDAVTLADDTTLVGTTPTFTGGVTGAGYDLALDFSGTTVITGAAFTGIRNLSTGNGGGGTTLSGTLTTTGNQTFHDDVTLAADTTLDAGTGSILLAGVVSGGFALTPLTSGSGTTTLSGANTNATTNVASGVVILANASPQTTAFVVSGGTLRGTGAVGSLTATGTGVLAPGASPGTIAAASLALATGAALQIEIAGTTAGTGYDQLVVASGGTVALGGATLGLSASAAPPADTVLTIIDNQTAGPVSGTFAGLPEGAIVSLDTQDYRISYVGGTGNDVTLTAMQTDDIVVSVSGDSEVVLRLASKGVTISDLRTAYSAKANTVTITAVNGGTIFTRSAGIATNSATGTITVSLAAIPAFAGISIVGGNGTDSVTLGPGGVNLAAVAGGGASQSFRIDTGNGATDSIAVTRPIVAKGAGVVALATAATVPTGGIRLAAPVTTGSGAQTYAGPVVLAANTTLASGRDGDITFAHAVDGARTLTVSSGGLVRFLGAVGAATPLRGVTVAKAAGVRVADGFALRGAGVATKADGLTIAAGVNNVVFSDTYTGSGRMISGFGGSGIRLAGSSAGSRFAGITSTGNGTGLRVDAGSYATTSITGCSFRESMNAGVSLANARGLALGTAAAGNSISANAGWGLYASGTLSGTQVHNNSIDGNGKFGVYLEGATGLLLGGTAPNAGNRIVNTTAWGRYSTGVYATGNLFGTRVEGNTIRANGGNGVTLANAQRITIGGPGAGAGNLIDSNGGFGVSASGTCTGSLVQGNLITGNAFGTVNVRNAKGIRVV
jgi:hypothetical protein